jgi:tetratricopeptide (TPR) repeat protein
MGFLQLLNNLTGTGSGFRGRGDKRRADAEAHMECGVELASRGQADEALAEFRKAASICPKMAEAHFNIGLTWMQQRNHAAAAEAFTEAINLDGEYVEAYYNLGLAYVALGKQRLGERKDVSDLYDKARRACLAAVRLQGKNVDALQSLGQVYYELGAHSEAFKAWHRAVSIRPDYAPAYHSLIRLYHDLGETEKAQQLSEVLKRIDAAWASSARVYVPGQADAQPAA